MTPFSSPETSYKCTQNGVHLVRCMQGSNNASASRRLPACTPPTAKLCGVFMLGQALSSEPRMHVTRAMADEYVAAEVARSVNRGKAIQFTRVNPQFAIRGTSAVMGAGVVERAAQGSPRDQAITAEWKWKPQTKGAHHHAQTKPSTHAATNQHEPAA